MTTLSWLVAQVIVVKTISGSTTNDKVAIIILGAASVH